MTDTVFIFPLSFAQQRLWFFQQIEPQSIAYSIPEAYRLKGMLNIEVLRQSFQEIVRRHEVLRTSFTIIDEEPVQVVHPALSIDIAVETFEAVPEAEREREIRRHIQKEALIPFDLSQAPLLRVKLFCRTAQEHILFLNIHHIGADDWSMRILYRELTVLYDAYLRNEPVSLAEPSIQYADYAIWQREWLQGEVLNTQLDYWQQQLGGIPLLALPTDYPRATVQRHQGANQTIRLSRELSTSLKVLALQEQATPFMVLLTAFTLLLSRYSGQNDISIGSPIANRSRIETEDLIGFFLNMLVLRTRWSGHPTFRELLCSVREVTLNAYDHQDLPFDVLVEKLHAEYNLSRTPLFQVALAFQTTPAVEITLPAMQVEWFEVENTRSRFDLEFYLRDTPDGITGILQYNIDLFAPATITRMLAHFQVLLEYCVVHPDQAVTTVPMLLPAEYKQVLYQWNTTYNDVPTDLLIHQIFEEQALHYPENSAVIFANTSTSYQQLNKLANQLAHYLQKHGVGPEVPVGFCMERSLEMIIAILAVLKAGGTYLPLDPESPLDRLLFMLRDAQVSILLTQQHSVSVFRDLDLHVFCIDADWTQVEQEANENLHDTIATAQNLAYIIYTSGTTGQPKGIQIEHRSLINLVHWHQKTFEITPTDRASFIANPAFDACVWEIWPYLASGASICIPDEETRRDVPRLQQWLISQAISVSFLPTPLAESLLMEDWQGTPALRVLLTGGDQLRHSPPTSLPFSLINNYGPTENTVVTTSCLVPPQHSPEFPAIGKPISNISLYILDPHLQPVPVGIPGELYIAGNGLARGYLHRPELTAECFLPNPFSIEPGARLYKTGDMVKYRIDGNVEFLGRLDHQVKIRGFRIEPGEIEAVLNRHEAVCQSIVIAQEGKTEEKRLIAYIATREGKECSVNELRKYLRERLPDYMVPSAFVLLTALPLTANGKIDRHAVVDLPTELADRQEVFVAPTTPLEEIVAVLWSDLLGYEQVSIHDNFFQSGGHSLLATQLISHIRKIMQVDLPLRAFFEVPTIAGLIQRIKKSTTGQKLQPPPVLAVSREQKLPLSFAQQRLWFLDQFEPDGISYNIPMVLRLSGLLNVEALECSIQEIIQRHEVLRTVFEAQDGQPMQVIMADVSLSLTHINLQPIREEKRKAEILRIAKTEAHYHFDLRRGPLLKATLLHISEHDYVLLLTMHHIISDGWSNGLFMQEITTLYNAFQEGKPSPLLPLPVQYADFAFWQHRWLDGEVAENLESYWKHQLGACALILNLPTDHPRPAMQTENGAHARCLLPVSLVKQLKALSKQEGVTFFMTMLAAFQVLLYRYTGQEQITVGTPVANRNHADIEQLIGLFINMLVLSTDVSGNPSFLHLLARVRETALEAYTHQDLPFEKLVEILQPERDLSRSPLFQVMLVLQNAPTMQGTMNGLECHPLEIEIGTAKYDLSLFLTDTEQGLLNVVEYNADLFDDTTILRLLDHWQILLEAIVKSPAKHIAQLPLLPTGERQRVILEWNAAKRNYPKDIGIHRLIEIQARQTPEAIALSFEGEDLTYEELNQRANRVAHFLCYLGIERDSAVGLCVERSLAMVVGLLGILKAGAAYVPLDPSYPQERIAFMLENARVSFLLTQRHLQPLLPNSSIQMIYLDHYGLAKSMLVSTTEMQTIAPAINIVPENLAYIIYTSGSTGQPKGTIISHRAVINFFQSMDRLGITAQDTILAVTSLSFDIAVLELLFPLTIGAHVQIILRETAMDSSALAEYVKTVTVMQATPSMWRLLISEGWAGNPRLKMLCGGETLTPELAAQLRLKGASLWNMYGPTETTIWSAICNLGNPNTAQGTIVIGQGIDNTQLYILDQYLEPVPVGVKGDLYIGGDGLALGYLYRPDLTAEKFLPDPFSQVGGVRMYQTGDIARWLPDGTIEHLGRSDQQIKFHGYRIELGEIEMALEPHPFVQSAAVVVQEDLPNNQHLTAYLVPDSTTPAHQNKRAQDRELIEQWQRELIPGWATVWDQIYRETPVLTDETLNFSGWNSSYDGKPIPEKEMQEWLDWTVARILALQPRRVLEIGCGNGLLLFRVAPQCHQYIGTDFSAQALASIRRQGPFSNITLLEQTADNFSGFEAQTFDTIILNSVVQYFSSLDYLSSVLEAAAHLVEAGGHIFIGDVRSLPLLNMFHTSVQLAQANPAMTLNTFKKLIHTCVLQDQELVIDPAFFYSLPQQIPRISQIELQLKRGHADNELTRFRYDVILHIGSKKNGHGTESTIPWLNWQEQALTLSDLSCILADRHPDVLGLTHIPNARFSREQRLLSLLAEESSFATVGELRDAMALSSLQNEINPEDFYALGDVSGYHTTASWSADSSSYYSTVLFQRTTSISQGAVEYTLPQPIATHYSNQPLFARFLRQPGPLLRSYLWGKLPEYMVPSVFVLLDTLPLTPNGKTDRRALMSKNTKPTTGEIYLAPRTPLEETLVALWEQILGIKRISIAANFFELGGHSLLATQIASRICNVVGIQISLRTLFEHPTIASLAGYLNGFQEKRSIPPPIQRVEHTGAMPLSFAQQRLWFLDQFVSRPGLYNIPSALRLFGPLNIPIIEQSFNAIIKRHELLRTIFIAVKGVPKQVIMPDLLLPLLQINLSHLSVQEQETRIGQIAESEALYHFHLQTGPLLRITLLCLNEMEHILLMNIHHSIADHWSTNIFNQELTTLYTAFLAGQSSPLAPLPIHYNDYANWQQEWLQGAHLETLLTYWRTQLANLPTLALPTDRSRPPVETFHGSHYTLYIPPPQVVPLVQLSRQQNVTFFMVLLAVFNVLLFRYTGQTDIVVGTTINGRNQAELEGVMGPFINTLVLRTSLANDPPFLTLLQRVKDMTLDAYAHQDMPFEKLVEKLRPKRDLSANPLFQVAIVLQNTPSDPLRLPDLSVQPLDLGTQTAKFDLTLFIDETADGLNIPIEYNTDLFEHKTIVRLAHHFQTLLESVVARPEEHISHLPLLTPDEHYQMLVTWNDTHHQFPDHREVQCVHQLFEFQAEQTPEHTALIFMDQQLSYREVNNQTNQLARFLRKHGVGPEVRVGIYMQRSIEMVVGILAVLKAGGAYVPLDIRTPRDRLAFVLDDAQVLLVLTQKQLQDHLPVNRTRTNLLLDESGTDIERESTEALVNLAFPQNLAYSIFTSGSTGKPKGVMVTHEGLVNYVRWSVEAYNVSAGDGSLVHTPLAFDLTVTSLFSPLMVGQKVILLPEDEGVEILRSALQGSKNLSLIKISPSHLDLLRYLLPMEEVAQYTQAIVIGGETLHAESLAFWQTHAPHTRLINEYGPTETVVGCGIYEIQADRHSGPVPIGSPIANMQFYILDEYLQLLPVGIPGELYIGGIGVARGYLGHPDLTANRFLPNPFGKSGERFYRSGDRARYLPDGTVELLGRVDYQVKLQGYRIELGEIEQVLLQHPVIEECAVILQQGTQQLQRLVAYLVLKPGESVQGQDLRYFLQTQLPRYMVPSAFVTLKALPLTLNGKIHRQALAELAAEAPLQEKNFVAPRTPVEESIAVIWRDLLAVEQISINDHFFDLGGHSLQVLQLIQYISERFQITLSVRQIVEADTIDALTQAILARQAEQADITRFLDKVQALSPEEIAALLAAETQQ